jgi:IS5 family transposase
MEMQRSFGSLEFAGKKKVTKREMFLALMEEVVPWSTLVAVIKPFYPKGERGRPPMGIEKMLRIYFLQQWYGLADEALEDALYDSQALRSFAGIDLSAEAVPDATTLLKFRHLLERHRLTQAIFEEVDKLMAARGLRCKEGTIIDATIIHAPSSTKNTEGKRDPDMHQTKKGNQWYFGMKAHIGVDAQSGLVHTVRTTAAHVADITQSADLLHGREREVYADAGYQGVQKRPEVRESHPQVQWHVAMKPGKLRALEEGPLKQWTRQLEHAKASVRAKVEHPFRVIKAVFGYRKTRYRGLEKSTAQLYSLFALANLYKMRFAL